MNNFGARTPRELLIWAIIEIMTGKGLLSPDVYYIHMEAKAILVLLDDDCLEKLLQQVTQ